MAISKTYLFLQQQIADELGNRTDLLFDLADSGIADSSPIKRAIASAIAKWEREHFYFNEAYSQPLFTTVAGQELYGTADAAAIVSAPDLWVLHALVSGNRYTLTRRSWAYIEEISPNSSLSGQPAEWAYFAEQIRLYPIPDAAYPVRATRLQRLADLAADADTNVWTSDAFDLIRCEAKMILARDTLQDPSIVAACELAIDGNPMNPRDRGYLGALRAETTRQGRARIRPSQF